MDEIRLQRLQTIIASMNTLVEQAVNLNAERPWTEVLLEQARILSSKLQSITSRFNTELSQYFDKTTDPDSEEISRLTTLQLEGEDILAELNGRLLSYKESKKQTTSNVRSKLPEIQLPTFRGEILQWYQFWDQFSSNIDQRNLTDVDKLLYLKSSLRDEAKEVLEGLKTTNLNYQIAVDTLQDRYGRKSQVIDAHYSALYKIQRAENTEGCRKTLDEIERHLRVLQSMGEDINRNNLRFLIMEKFPEDIIYAMKLKLTTDTIEDMRKQISVIITTHEDSRRAREGASQENKYTTEALHTRNEKPIASTSNYRHNQQRKRNYQPTASSYHKRFTPTKRRYNDITKTQTNHVQEKKPKITCIFCQGNHFNDQCRKFETIEKRKKQLGQRCFKCLFKGHLARECRSKKDCPHCGTVSRHNRALCPKKQNIKPQFTNVLHARGDCTTVLQTAIVEVVGSDNKTKRCRVLLDSGSQRSYVTQNIAKELNLIVEEENHLSVFTFGSNQPREIDSPLVRLDMQTKTNVSKAIYVNVVPTITHGVAYPKGEFENWINEEEYIMADDGSLLDRIDILIGNDYYYSLMTTEKIQIKENLHLVNSEFGWILSGKIENRFNDNLSVLTYFQSTHIVKLTEPDMPLDYGNVKLLWDLESIGITDSPKTTKEEEAIKNFNDTTTFENNRYHVSWPWNEYPPDLQSNFGLAYGRLVSLVKRMDSNTLSNYEETLRDQLDKGIIEITPTSDKRNHPVHYLPHHGVSAPEKSLRIVYDASAKTGDGKSLNECLYCGPIMLEDLTGLLIQFRCHSIGVTADVEKAFLQIGLHDEDRDVTRFLWLKNIQEPVTKENLICFRFTRVPFGIISSPFLLNATIKHHLQNAHKENVKQLANNIYVDNVLTGTSTTQETLDLYQDSKEAFQQISMNLREWSSNSKEFIKQIPDACKEKVIKTLGLNWNTDEDTLCLRTKETRNAHTKRGVLKTLASVYDPCGFAVPILLPAKLFLQELWKRKVKWDTPLTKDMSTKWQSVEEDLKQAENICLQRYIYKKGKGDCQLHCFTDSSTVAYSAVVYITQGNNISFLIGKSRLVPTKDQEHLKIPRLELLGVLIGSRLIQYVLKFLKTKILGQTLWTDSQIVIDWYHSSKLLPPFVARRIEEIKRNKALTIRYVPSNLNPADVATRPTNLKEDYARWLQGPDFLSHRQEDWPSGPAREVTLVVREGLAKEDQPIEVQKEQMKGEEVTTSTTTVNSDTKVQEIRMLQLQSFPEEVKGKETHLTRNLGLFKDIEGILRCDGRLTHSDLSYETKHPILLPRDCEFTNKVIRETHEANYHVGVPHTLSMIRKQYWIPQGRTQVQKVIGKCPQCVKHGGGPYVLPKTPALPQERVNYSTAYNYTGMDYFGPVYVKIRSCKEKRWICLFTCLVVRAIHLEIVKDLTAEECLLAVRRFIAARGVPSLILSDNATQFRLLAEVIAEDPSNDQIRWKFIPQLAPWHGGAYERLVALVKRCLTRTLQKHLLGDNQLLTVIKEVEAVVNTRPLTYVGAGLEQTLKPADFLTPGKCVTINPIGNQTSISNTSTKQQLIEGWKRGEIIMKEYKDMFVNQYLLSLRERYRNSPKQPRIKVHRAPCVGDIVQIKGDLKNRETWKVGKIIELVKGLDGLCRVAKVRVGNNTYTRSIAHLYPLEADETETQSNSSRIPTEPESLVDSQDADQENDIPVTIPIDLIEESDEVNQELIPLNRDHPELDQTRMDVDQAANMDISNEEENMNEDLDLTEDSNEAEEVAIPNRSEQQRHQRAAATRAREKIREWTRNLFNLLH